MRDVRRRQTLSASAPPRNARELLKLTRRHPIAYLPLRGRACALSIRTYRPLTRAPSSGPSCVLYIVRRRRQAPPPPPLCNHPRAQFHHIPSAPAPHPRAVGARTPQIVHRTWADLVCLRRKSLMVWLLFSLDPLLGFLGCKQRLQIINYGFASLGKNPRIQRARDGNGRQVVYVMRTGSYN